MVSMATMTAMTSSIHLIHTAVLESKKVMSTVTLFSFYGISHVASQRL